MTRAFVGPPLVFDLSEELVQTDAPDGYEKVFAVPLRSNHKAFSVERVSKMHTAIGKASKVILNGQAGRPVKFASALDIIRCFGTLWAMNCAAAVQTKLMRQASLDTAMAFYADNEAVAMAENLEAGEGVGAFVGSC